MEWLVIFIPIMNCHCISWFLSPSISVFIYGEGFSTSDMAQSALKRVVYIRVAGWTL